MHIIEHTGADDIKFPLPLYASAPIADATHGDDTFTIMAGLDEALVRQLTAYSLDPADTAVQNETSDRKRFGEGSYEAWYAKDRTPFALVRTTDKKLAALLWFGPEVFAGAPALPSTEEWHTVAYRSYAPFRGKGLMKDFSRFAIGAYQTLRPSARLWAAIHSDNIASIKLAEALGFEQTDRLVPAESSQVVMVQKRI